MTNCAGRDEAASDGACLGNVLAKMEIWVYAVLIKLHYTHLVMGVASPTASLLFKGPMRRPCPNGVPTSTPKNGVSLWHYQRKEFLGCMQRAHPGWVFWAAGTLSQLRTMRWPPGERIGDARGHYTKANTKATLVPSTADIATSFCCTACRKDAWRLLCERRWAHLIYRRRTATWSFVCGRCNICGPRGGLCGCNLCPCMWAIGRGAFILPRRAIAVRLRCAWPVHKACDSGQLCFIFHPETRHSRVLTMVHFPSSLASGVALGDDRRLWARKAGASACHLHHPPSQSPC